MNKKAVGTYLTQSLRWWNGTAKAGMAYEKGHTGKRVIWALLLPHSNVIMDASEVVIPARVLLVTERVAI